MTPSNSELRAQLGTSLKHLVPALRELSTHLRHHSHEAWVWNPGKGDALAFDRPPADLSREDTLKRIADAIEDIEYDDTQRAHESRIYPGIVAVSRGGLALADEVNRLKRSLADALKAMEGRTEIGVIDQRTGERGPRPLREVALEAFFSRRLHPWQATRRLEILKESDSVMSPPEYVGFMWANSREVRKTTSTELIKQARAPDARIMSESDIAVLEALPADEPLALVRPGNTTPKANIRFPPHDGRPAVSKVRIAVLPLLVLGDRLPARLRKLPPAPTPKHFRLARADVEIESAPIINSPPVYRYLAQFRDSKRRERRVTEIR